MSVTHSVFGHNAQQRDGYAHNVYIGSDRCETFVFRGNLSIGTKSGHQVKSRCRNHFIRYNFLSDQDDGRASYTIDLPEGGYSEVVGNLIPQGSNAENSGTLLRYGAEGKNPEMVLLLAHNTFVNDKHNTPAFVRTKGATKVVMRNKLFIGTGIPLETSSDPNLDSLGDLQVEDGSELMDRLAYDYQLSSWATAVDSGSPIQAPFSQLIPSLEYIPGGTRARWDDGAPDVGAYGIGEPKDSGDSGNSGDSGKSGTDSDSVVGPVASDCTCTSTSTTYGSHWLLLVGSIVLLRRRQSSGAPRS